MGQVNLVHPFPEPGVGKGSPHQDQAGVAGKLQIPLNHLKVHVHPLGEALVGEDINRKIDVVYRKATPAPLPVTDSGSSYRFDERVPFGLP